MLDTKSVMKINYDVPITSGTKLKKQSSKWVNTDIVLKKILSSR